MARSESLSELMSGQMPERYLRNLGTIGIAGQLLLLQATVAVIGAGGLGGHVIELLSRQGVGHLVIIDGDSFSRHNLNRQILATELTLGMNKAEVAAARVADINPDVQVRAYPMMLDSANALYFLSGINVIVDALDSISNRRMLLRIAQELRIPLVHAAIAGFTGQVSTVMPEDHGIATLFGKATPSDRGVEVLLGNPATTPAVAAALQSQEVIKLITGVGQPLSRQLLYFDLEYNLFEKIQLE